MIWTICCAVNLRATASRMRWRTRSNCRAGRVARSMPARLNSPARPMRTATMARKMTKPDDAGSGAAPVKAAARAAALLMAKGYRILARRFRTPYGEIDIVAKRRNLIAFIEVKARGSLDDAAYAVTPRQQQRIIEAAQAWLMAHPEHAEFELRFDAMLIAPRRLPRHLLAAFDAST